MAPFTDMNKMRRRNVKKKYFFFGRVSELVEPDINLIDFYLFSE